jgi:hypothetical protein
VTDDIPSFEGHPVQKARLRVAGTIETDEILDYGDEVTVLLRGPITSIDHGDHQNLLTRKQALTAAEVYVIDEDDVAGVLTEQRKLAKARRDDASGQTALDDDLDDDAPPEPTGADGGLGVFAGDSDPLDDAIAISDAADDPEDDEL